MILLALKWTSKVGLIFSDKIYIELYSIPQYMKSREARLSKLSKSSNGKQPD